MNAKIRSCLTAAMAALATMGIVVAANWPNYLNAKAAPPPKKAPTPIKIPTMTVNGCHLSILPQPKGAKADRNLVLQIEAVNTTDKPINFDMKVAVRSMSPQSRFSRSMSMPIEIWRGTCLVSLAAGEATIIDVPTGKKVSAFGLFSTPYVTVGGKRLNGRPFTALIVPATVRPARTPNGNILLKPAGAKTSKAAPAAKKAVRNRIGV